MNLKPPPLIAGAALLFWGWRTDMLGLAAVGAFLIELVHLVPVRWQFSDKEFNRLWDICTIIFVGSAVYLRFSETVVDAAYKFFRWFPLIFYPMVLGHLYSARESVPLKAFSWFLRRRGAEGGEKPVAFGWIYIALCVITAGSSTMRDIWFYLGVTGLTGWALWMVRPRRLSTPTWSLIFVGIAVVGFVTQSKMPELQSWLESKASELFVHMGRKEFDPQQTRTAMGRIGSLKQSSRVVLKVHPEKGPVPARLRQSTYVRLEGVVWRGSGRTFENVPVEPDTTTWTLQGETNLANAVRIIQRVPKKSALLSVPLGTAQLRDLSSVSVETNMFGVIRANENPTLVSFLALHGENNAEVSPLSDGPMGWDLDIPEIEQEAIKQVAMELGVEEAPIQKKIAAIDALFSDKFGYTTYQEAREVGLHTGTPLSEFLLRTRAGHCEYFASATVLLLRHFGIPARYATGYAVQEGNREDDSFIVRERHAHAWALAWVNGRWVEVDTTPASWASDEAKDFPYYQPLKDAWERLTFAFLELRWLGSLSFFRTAAPWLLTPLILILAWRVFGRRMVQRQERFAARELEFGADSEFYLLEKKLRRRGLERLPDETMLRWLNRVRQETPGASASLIRALKLHYKYRFDPQGISLEERRELQRTARACLAEI